MSELRSGDRGRRDFLTRAVPACSLACLGMGNLLAQTGADGKKKQDAAHKFDVVRPGSR
jgi:hypothetical protein